MKVSPLDSELRHQIDLKTADTFLYLLEQIMEFRKRIEKLENRVGALEQWREDHTSPVKAEGTN